DRACRGLATVPWTEPRQRLERTRHSANLPSGRIKDSLAGGHWRRTLQSGGSTWPGLCHRRRGGETESVGTRPLFRRENRKASLDVPGPSGQRRCVRSKEPERTVPDARGREQSSLHAGSDGASVVSGCAQGKRTLGKDS